ncbi:MAG TPA: hypothetical protein VH143_06780 [Kofleriaceae bacterium]|nr:hypothetical protein [Kofleriaceae bacterium]
MHLVAAAGNPAVLDALDALVALVAKGARVTKTKLAYSPCTPTTSAPRRGTG